MTAFDRWLLERKKCHCLHPNAETCYERGNPPPCDDSEFGEWVELYGDSPCECACHFVFLDEPDDEAA